MNERAKEEEERLHRLYISVHGLRWKEEGRGPPPVTTSRARIFKRKWSPGIDSKE